MCVFCDLLAKERSANSRLVDGSPYFLAFCPFASRFPYEMWVLPRSHHSQFEGSQDVMLDDLAFLMRRLLKRLEEVSHCTAYNYFIHTAPFDTKTVRHYHWHVEILPRLTTVAGFEWATGCYVNPIPPEEAAKRLSPTASSEGLQFSD